MRTSYKSRLIRTIKETIKDCGIIQVGEFTNNCPFVESNGNLTHLIEEIHKTSVKINVYGDWENAIDTYFLDFEKLEETILEELLEYCQQCEAVNN